VAAADAWCLLAHLVDPQKVCAVSLEEDMFAELVSLLSAGDTEVSGWVMGGWVMGGWWAGRRTDR
jgi:hypothetical protein